MTMRKTIGLSLVLLVASGAAMAKQERGGHPDSATAAKPRAGAQRNPATSRTARARQRETGKPAARAPSPRHAQISGGYSAERSAREVRAVDRVVATRHAVERFGVESRVAPQLPPRAAVARYAGPRFVAFQPAATATREAARAPAAPAALPPPDEYISTVRVVGRPEIGKAAWYGGGFLGQRTASGEPLDSVHVTAAHRTLPLFTRVRVTNLHNGRSIIATINDRGPVSHRLLIDLSPRAAQELQMIGSGVAPVQIEPVVVTKVAAPRTVVARTVAAAGLRR